MGILKMHAGTRKYAACLFVAMFLSWLLPLSAGAADHIQIDASKVKAGLVYNFLKYTRWEGNADVVRDRTLKVCLFGGDPFDGALDPLQGRTAQQLTIDISRTQALDDIKNCSVVVIDKSQSYSVPTVLKSIAGRNILTLSDISGFAKAGGMVELAYRAERIRLVINAKAIDATGLQVEDRLLKLAEAGGR